MIDFTDIMRNKTDYLTLSEINSMLQFCYENNRTRDYMLILTLVRTGRRVSEVVGSTPYTRNVGLRPVDIRVDDRLIEFDILKKNHIKEKTSSGKKKNPETVREARILKQPKRKLIPVDDDYLDTLMTYIKLNQIQPYERIFPITRQWVDWIIKDIAKNCGIARPKKGIHAHNFRHSLAINILKDNPENPYALIQIQDVLDHSNLNITRTYTQFTPEDIRKTLNKLFVPKEKKEEDDDTE